MQVRVWNIPEQRVVDWADVHEMVTATAFAPDGRRAVVGTMKGRCRFYQCEPTFKLEYQAQIGQCLLFLPFPLASCFELTVGVIISTESILQSSLYSFCDQSGAFAAL